MGSPALKTNICVTRMKFAGIFASAALVFDGINASLESMEKGFQELNEKISGGNRNMLSVSLKNLDNYGCWCYFDEAVGNGKGLPRDFIDEECRALHRSYECAIAEIPNCIPYSVQTTTVGGLVETFGSELAACKVIITPVVAGGAQNVECSIADCAAETKFIENVTGYLVNNDAFFHNLTHLGIAWSDKQGGSGIGEFNPERECIAECPSGKCYSDKTDRKCCGVMPERFPYKVHPNTPAYNQDCCGDQNVKEEVFQTATHQCVNGEVKPK